MPLHHIIDNHNEKLVGRSSRILAATQVARFAIG
jgi:hypothetical protein